MGWQQRDPKKRKSYKKRQNRPGDTHEAGDPAPENVSPGRITGIESQKKNANRVSIYINDQFGFGLHHDVLLQHGLHTGVDLEASQIRELQAADALIRAKEAAITYLGHRARTEKEVRQKLQGKGFDGATIDQVIVRLYELSYLDDASFARTYTQNRFTFKGYGPQRIRAELRRLGVASPLIEAAIAEAMPANVMYERAFAEAEKRLRRLRNEQDPSKRRQKLYGFLMRRGHTPDVVRAVIENIDL